MKPHKLLIFKHQIGAFFMSKFTNYQIIQLKTQKAGEKMGIKKFFGGIFKREVSQQPQEIDPALLTAWLSGDPVDASKAMNIPAVAACVHLISETVSMIPIKLYREEFPDGKRKTVEVVDDNRPDLLNLDTRDTLDGVQFKRAIVRDYLLYGNAYAFINKKANKFASVNYVARRNISIISSPDPIFKDYNILVGGRTFMHGNFIDC